MHDPIPVNTPLLSGKEKEYLIECIDTGWISSEGPFVKKFEAQFSSYVDRKYGIAVANGSGALDCAIAALNLDEGSEVIMPTFTIISCALSILRNDLIPVLVDSDPYTWNMDVDQIEAKITPKTKAIMAVHIYGLPVDMDPILALAQKYNLKIIEDAAQAIGQTYKGKPCGSLGDISCFSFYPNKHITTGEGGMIVTNNDKLAERSQSFRNLCFKPEKRFEHEEMGWNYRMTNLQAALGLAQLEKIDEHIEKKYQLGKAYNKLLNNCPHIQLPCKKTNYAENIYWVYGLVLKETTKISAKECIKKLGDSKIGTRPFFWNLHEQPVFKKQGLFIKETYPNAEHIARNGFYLPSGLALTEDELKIVSLNIHKAIN